MKKVILSLAIVAIAFGAKAQTSFGAQAGANFASFKQTATGTPNYSSDTKVGFTVGAVANVDFGNSISFRPELNFIQKGGKAETSTTSTGFSYTSKDEVSLSYIQLSPNFVYNIAAGTGKVFVGVGPEFAFGMGGKYKSSYTQTIVGTTTTGSGDVKVKFDGKDNATSTDPDLHLKSFDFGGNILAGYKLANGAFISVGYTLGFSNISPDANTTWKNNGFNVKIGFMFGGSGSAE